MSNNASAKINWTREQLAGIQTTGRSLLVSAAAGSGKTAVLAQRCAYLVCDAKPPCDVDQLLVVTFTEAAAAEMKGRIESVLRERLASKEDDPRLVKQLALVERAQVSTLHGFCSRVLRQNFHLLGLDPGFSMLDGDESTLMRMDVARELFADRYENDATGDFGRLVRFYAGGDDESLIPQLLRTHEMLSSIVDQEAWLNRARDRINQAATGRLEESEAGGELVKMMSEKIRALTLRCSQAIANLARAREFGKYIEYLEKLEEVLEGWAGRLETAGINSLSRAVKTFSADKLPSIRSDTPGKALAKAAVDSVREEMKENGSLARLARFSREEWQAGLRSIAPTSSMFLDLVEEFAIRYRRAKDQARRLDFNDLERFALQILRDENSKEISPSGVARGYHKQFQHVLVDEYQDINEVQDTILHLVSRECAAIGSGHAPNLFCVGDVKQSIYRFRLAEPERFLKRYKRFKAMPARAAVPPVNQKKTLTLPSPRVPGEGATPFGEVIDLQANFRSRAPLLEILNQIFVRLMTAEATDIEYDQSHHLSPMAAFPPGDSASFTGAPVELHLLPEDVPMSGEDDEELDRSEREAQFVARRIRQVMGQDGSAPMTVIDQTPAGRAPRPIQYRDIVILLRSMKFKADQYADTLTAAGIPVHRESGQGYFQSMEVRDMRALLTLLDNPRQDIPMAAVLRSPFAALASPEDCLARVRLAYPPLRPERSRRNRASSQGQPVAFHQAVALYASEKDDDLAAALSDFLQTIERWRQLARHRPLAELIWEIYDQSGYLAFCEGLTNGPQRVANLINLHERAAQFGSFSQQGLYRFLKFLESLEDATDFGQASVLSQAADVVRIMSVHRSKGLEFPVVFLPELGKKINLQDTQGGILIDKEAGLGLSAVDEAKRIRYPSLASVLVQTRLHRQSLAEELRVLYVATTRAKEHLILSGTCTDKKRDQWAEHWTAHTGPMPPEDLLSANTMLDWIGPAVSMINSDQSFQVTAHTPEEVGGWTSADLKRPSLTPLQQKLARLDPLNPAPPPDDRAARIITALTSDYSHAQATHIEAARSVTDWTKQGRAAPVGYASQIDQTVTFERTLATPKCLLTQDDLSAADIGTATHLVLQHLDFSRCCTATDLVEQINSLVTRKLLTALQAKRVDLSAIEWFVASDLGRRMQQNPAQLRREMDFYLAVPPSEFTSAASSTDPLDQVMIRGRIDAILLAPAGLTVIDYKTDRVAADKIPERAEFYAPQVSLYRRALERITRQPVTDVHLVFLTARRIVSN